MCVSGVTLKRTYLSVPASGGSEVEGLGLLGRGGYALACGCRGGIGEVFAVVGCG